MRRLAVLLAVLFASAGTACIGMAQQVSGVPRVGVLHQTSSEGAKRTANIFRDGMRSLGWIDGRTIAIEDRFANGDSALLSANAAEFAAAKVDVLVAFSSLPARAAHQATSSIPIVMDTGDPVFQGLVASLARPGGNVTGQSLMRTDMVAKQLQMLKEVVPRAGKIGVLVQAGHAPHGQQMTELERAAVTLGISVLPVAVGAAQDLPRLFDEMTAAGADAYLVLNEPRTDAMRGDIIAFALHHRLPGAAQERRYAEAGVLFSYGVSLDAIHQRAAFFVDKILKGAKPADLPVEQPTTFEFIINLKTAKALGLTVAPSILARADEIIE